jgi:hypothetical protein
MHVENQMNRVDFILNRLDNVAMDVVSWMPPEDNAKHHNAVEMLQRARQELLHLRSFLEAEYLVASEVYTTPGVEEREGG